MADRNELLQEKAGLVQQQQEILNSANARIEEFVKPIREETDAANARIEEFVKPIREETDAAVKPLSARVAEINVELLNALDSEAGITHNIGE